MLQLRPRWNAAIAALAVLFAFFLISPAQAAGGVEPTGFSIGLGQTGLFDWSPEHWLDLLQHDPEGHEEGQDHGSGHNEEVSAHDEGEGHHGTDMSPLFFVILALIIGAGTRHFLQKTPIPFTVLLLLFGLGLGALSRSKLLESLPSFSSAIDWAGTIDPHVILFVFLPTLIFEAAFAMDVHTFKKTVVNAIILAVPGIIIALCLTGALVMGLKYSGIGLTKWTWSLALMFGAVVSATDPVAVVALLKELGASKKLGTLIEGESLLNDGTAIVFFMVFFNAITMQASDLHPVIAFSQVSFGGLLLGIVIGLVAIAWVKRVFNDALVEISVIVAAAYLTFYIAEEFMHVSGVLGLVALGLAMAGVGRTRISPEVEHFLHEFWELAAFIANTLIFLIVGVVVAERIEIKAEYFGLLFIFYIGIHIVRAIVIFVLFPLMKNTGYGLNKKEAMVAWYGALRGAIGLALALIVAGAPDEYISKEIKGQFLFITAGIVTLTLLVNATTIKFLVNYLGLTKLAPAKAVMLKSASEYIRTSAENHMQKLQKDRNLRKANWSAVAKYLPGEISLVEEVDEKELKMARVAEHRRRILEKEKSSYWRQFKEGMLAPTAVQTLSETVNEILDDSGEQPLSNRKDLELLWRPPKWLSRVQNWPVIGNLTENAFFDRLAVSYDCAVGFVRAQEDSLKLMESMYRSEPEEERPLLEMIEQEINENIISGQTFMRNLRNTYPEIYRAISTRQAIRAVLNYERHQVERLKEKGRLDGGESAKMIHDIEARMKRLMEKPPKVNLPETEELMKGISWLQDLEEASVIHIKDICQTKIFSNGQVLMKPNRSGQGIYIIARGNVRLMEDKDTMDVVGKGDAIGTWSVLTGDQFEFKAVAETPVTALWLSKNNAQRILSDKNSFESILWKVSCERIALQTLSHSSDHANKDTKMLKRWVSAGSLETVKAKTKFAPSKDKIAFFIQGKTSDSSLAKGTEVGEGGFEAVTDCKVWVMNAE